MRNKIFISIIFDKVKIIALYFILLFWAIYFILIQIDAYQQVETDLIEIPDIEIVGNMEWKDNQNINQNIMMHDILAKEIFTFSSPFYDVSYYLYGVEQDFFQLFHEKEMDGKVPEAAKKEIIVGNNVAVYYQFNVGDIIDFSILFQDENMLEGEYIISGILSDEDRFYGNGIYISKVNSKNYLKSSESDLTYIYVSNKKAHKEIKKYIKQCKSDSVIEDYKDNYDLKYKGKNKAINNIILTILISFFILCSLFLYLIKGMSGKVGILKALGISDGYVIGTFCLGFGVFITTACILNFVIVFFTLNIALLLSLISITIIGFVMFTMSILGFVKVYKKVLPSY